MNGGVKFVNGLVVNEANVLHKLAHLCLFLIYLETWRTGFLNFAQIVNLQAEVESRTQGSRPRPRTQKKSEAKDSLSEDRHPRGQGQECSRPRPRKKDTSASAFQKKRSSQKFLRRSPQKNVFQKIFQALHKILLFKKLCCPRAEDRPIFEDLKPRG